MILLEGIFTGRYFFDFTGRYFKLEDILMMVKNRGKFMDNQFMKSPIIFLISTFVHMMLTFVFIIFPGSFDVLEKEPALYEKILTGLSAMLLWPGSWIHSVVRGNDAIEWVLFICNSLFWGGLITSLYCYVRRGKKSAR